MSYSSHFGRPGWAGSTPAEDWRNAASLLGARMRRSVWLILACGVAGGAIGAGVKSILPPSYTATTQLLFDPRGFKVFNNELTTGNYDANAAINYVESQMAVLQSERVLSRVVQAECAARSDAAGGSFAFARYCTGDDKPGNWPKALQELHKAVNVKRQERSFVVDIYTTSSTPELAARLGGSLVVAYTQEDAVTRNEAAGKLTADLSGRLETLRDTVQASDARAEVYRRDKDLIRVGDKLLVEQRLAAATASLTESQSHLDRATARVKQIEAATQNPSALGALGAEADTRTLATLLERRNGVLMEIAPLAKRVGARHPLMIDARSRLAEVDRSIATEMGAIRSAAHADIARARTEQANLAATVADLSAKVTKARQSEIELRTIEQEADANRKLLESFETRSREASEFGKIDSANLRIVSVPRAPDVQGRVPKLIEWGLLGLAVGLMLAISGVGLFTLLAPSPSKDKDDGDSEPGAGGSNEAVAALQMRAQTFAKYRYG